MEERKEPHIEHHPEHHVEHHIEHNASIEHHPKKSKSTPWVVSTVILAIIAIVLAYMVFFPMTKTNNGTTTVTSKEAGDKVIQFTTAQGIQATLVNVNDTGSFYQVTLSMQGRDVPVYVTKDGANLIPSMIPLSGDSLVPPTTTTATPTPQTVTKSAKPVVEAFVFAYCPYGLQFEKALFPVYDLLKAKADFKIVYIGAMHGEFEHVESLRQICIQKNYGVDKLFSYLKAFDVSTDIGACSGTDTCVNPLIDKIYTSLKIDKTKITTCMTNDAPALYDADGARSQSLGISGSPTFVINDAQVNVNRSPDAIKTAVCNAFTTSPTECTKALSTAAASVSFGPTTATGTAASSAASCG